MRRGLANVLEAPRPEIGDRVGRDDPVPSHGQVPARGVGRRDDAPSVEIEVSPLRSVGRVDRDGVIVTRSANRAMPLRAEMDRRWVPIVWSRTTPRDTP